MRKKISSVVAICIILLVSFSPFFDSVARAQSPSNPDSVNIPGTHQDELGCPGEWQPECENTMLAYDDEDDVWQGTFEIQPGNDGDKKGPRYKACLLYTSPSPRDGLLSRMPSSA